MPGTIYGRETEVSTLKNRILARERSVTFVVGETRIGKSWLLRKLGDDLETAGAFVGRHECQALAGADPVLPCLKSLAEQILADDGVLATATAKELADLLRGRAGELFTDLIEAVRELPYAGTVIDVLKALRKLRRDTAEGLRAQVNLAPAPLKVDEFANALLFLHSLVPATKLVLVIDNLSGAVTSERSPAASLLTTYVQQVESRGLPNLHFVIGWKTEPGATDDVYRSLRSELRPYIDEGEELRIGPFSKVDAEARLGACPWFLRLTPQQKQEFMSATGRFPEVLDTLATAVGEPTVVDAESTRANYIAKTYPRLEAALKRDERLPLLYQLALAPAWLTYFEIERLSGLGRREARVWLEGWRDRELVADDVDHAFRWRHETRTEVVRHVAERELFQDVRLDAARKLMNHYLEQVGFASPECPSAPYYGDYASSLRDVAEASGEQRKTIAIVLDSVANGRSAATDAAAVRTALAGC